MPGSPERVRICVEFAKAGAARFLAHLDLQEAFERALRRARVPLAFSQGYHPRPRLQFEDPLPLGWCSERERLWVDMAEGYPCAEVERRLRATAPPGIEILRAFPIRGRPVPPVARRYRVRGLAPAAVRAAESRAEAGAEAAADAGAPAIRTRSEGGSLEFTLLPGEERPAPSMKKILKELLGEKAEEGLGGLEVARLDWPAGGAAAEAAP